LRRWQFLGKMAHRQGSVHGLGQHRANILHRLDHSINCGPRCPRLCNRDRLLARVLLVRFQVDQPVKSRHCRLWTDIGGKRA
ncbi:MAG: hypothetical protein NTV52_02765, partial [Acidobacteria bacterium]|nr:hypothetical protein [Acidobacteriota bacterium]